MNNRKYIIIFGTLILLLVFVTGAVIIYRESRSSSDADHSEKYGYYLRPPKEGQVQIPNARQSFFTFSQPNPANSKEFLDFLSFCKKTLFSGIDELKDEEIKQVACLLTKMSPRSIDLYGFSNKPYLPGFFALKSILSFETGRYIGISVDLKDVVREYDPSLLEEEKLYFCSISEPSWTDPFYLQMEPKQDLIFDEGDVSCAGIKMDKTPSMNFSGFIPQAESLRIQKYLIDEQTVSDVMNRQLFSEIKEILKDYPIIWQMEKPIVP